MTNFTLDPRIASSSLFLRQCGFCELRLVNDSRYCWLLLIPQIADIVELSDLSKSQRDEMMDYATQIAALMQDKTKADKMNIATIGNIVPAMHLHIIARKVDDAAWPNPVWGNGEARPYEADALAATQRNIIAWLAPLA